MKGSDETMTIIAQLSDFHARPPGILAYGGLDTNAMMRRAVATVAALDPAPDCVVVTGDLADCGLAEEYREVEAALARLPMPVYVLPGNHDRRDVMLTVMGERHGYRARGDGFWHFAVDVGPLRLIGLDTVVPGEHGGEICPAREAWLAARLAEGEGRPTLVMLHHPPFLTGVATMDPMMCRSAPSLEALLRRHPEILRIAAGHYHRPIVTSWAGTIGFVAPGVAHQVALDLRRGEPNRLIHEPPGYALHVYDRAAGLVSHVVPIGDFGPVMDFELPPEYPGQEPTT